VGKILVLQSASELAGLFECLVEIDLEFHFSSIEEYIDEVIRENKSFQVPDSEDQDSILKEYFQYQAERIGDAGDDFDRLEAILVDYGTSYYVGDFCYLEEYIDGTYFYMWANHYSDFDDEFDEDEEISFKLPGSEEIVARTINAVNEIDSL
jgi:hypothetical protein